MGSVFNGNGANAAKPGQKVHGVIRADDVTMTLGIIGSSIGMVLQQAEWQLERTVNMLYEIGSAQVYYVGDRRKGQGKFTRVVTGVKDFKKLVLQLGDICQAAKNTLELKAGSSQCGEAGAQVLTYNLVGVTLTSLGVSITAQDIIVTESMGIMFSDMNYDEAAGGGGGGMVLGGMG